MKDDLEVYCPECGKLFKGEDKMFEHLENEHSENLPKEYGNHHCPRCKSEIHFKSIDGFKQDIAKPYINCLICGAPYKIKLGLNEEIMSTQLVTHPTTYNLEVNLTGGQ